MSVLQRMQDTLKDPSFFKKVRHNCQLQAFRESINPKEDLLWRLQSPDLSVVSAEKLSETTARAVYRFRVQPEYLNPAQNLHGGAQATFLDIGTSLVLSLSSKPGVWTSRTLNCTYLRPAALGEWLLMQCEVVHAGKRLCLVKGQLVREKDGAVISTCEHNKFNVDSAAAPKL